MNNFVCVNITVQFIKIFKYYHYQFRKMDEVSKEEITCVFDGDDSTPIFDKDDWEGEGSNLESSK